MYEAYRPRDVSRRRQGLTLALLAHVLIAWLLISGTARQGLNLIKKPLEAVVIREVIVPPPPPPPPPKPIKPVEAPVSKAPPPPFVPPPEVVPAAPSVAPAIVAVATPPEQPHVIAPPAPPAPAPAPVAESTPKLPQKQEIGLACPRQVHPEMPRRALEDGVQGTVKAQLVIVDGQPKEVVILSGPRVFHSAVRNAMMRYECVGKGEVIAVQEFKFDLTD